MKRFFTILILMLSVFSIASAHSDGELKLKGRYKNGLRDGEFKTYLMNAKSAGSVFYKDGKEIKSTLTNYMKEDVFFNFPDEMESLINTVSKKTSLLDILCGYEKPCIT